MLDRSICPGCSGEKSPVWRLCKSCFDIYGRDASVWPDWLSYSVADVYHDRWQDVQIAEHEVPFGAFEPGEEGELDGIAPLLTRPWDEMVETEGDLLPWAPYDDDEMNEAYRESHGIVAAHDGVGTTALTRVGGR